MATPEPDPTAPKAFISYSWDDDTHKEWVKQLATRLRADGVDVTLDRWHAAPGDQIPAFMERAVRENDFVIAVCTPRFKERSDGRGGGVGYEGDIMTAYAFTGGDKRKFIPVLRRGSWIEAAPTWLLGRAKIDLSGDPYSDSEYEELLRTLHGAREEAPPIGHRPNFGDKKGSQASPAPAPVTLLVGSSTPQHQSSVTPVVPTSRDGLSSRTTDLRVSLPMPKSVFISYSWKQGEWVWDRLVPCLEAGEAHVLIDRKQFEPAQAIRRQMDEVQDRADLNILVFSPDYLTSKPCRHEMKRAIKRDPEFKDGVTVPVKRVACDLPAAIRRPDPLYVDLTDDQKENPWDLLLRKCEADLGTPAPQWLKARDDIRRYLTRGESVNLTVQGKVRWKPLIDDLRRDPSLAGLREVNLRDPETYTRKGLVKTILAACGIPGPVPDKPGDLVKLSRSLKLRPNPAHLALTHFDYVSDHTDFEIDLFSALRYEMTDSRKLVLLIQSRQPFQTLLPKEHPLSSITTPKIVELKGRP
jgi:TIR domain